MEKSKAKEKATGKEKTEEVLEKKNTTKKMLEASAEEIAEMRRQQKDNCSKEINEILNKYNCDLTARIIVGEQGNIPQVFIIERRERK